MLENAFRTCRGVMDQIFRLKEIQVESNVVFIDFKQAYDYLNRKELFKGLKELGVNDKIRA